MNILQWQNTDKNQFAIFIRDLTINLNNVKHIIEDTIKEEKPIKKYKGNKKQVKKKKDIIIEQQTKLRLEKHLKEDLSKLDYLVKHVDKDNPYITFSQMKTEHGLIKLKFRLLIYLWGFKKTYFSRRSA